MPAPTARSASSTARRRKAPSRSTRRRTSPTWARRWPPSRRNTASRCRLWRGSSEDVARRVINEQRAGRFEVDVVETAGPDMEVMVREKALQPFHTPVSADADSGRDLCAPPMDRDPRQSLRRRLQHQADRRRGRAQALRGPARSALEGQARGRGQRRQLVHAARGDHGRGQGDQAVPRHRRGERHVGAQGPLAAGEPRADRRGAAGAHASTATASSN